MTVKDSFDNFVEAIGTIIETADMLRKDGLI